MCVFEIQASPILRQPADNTKVYVSWETEVLLNGKGDDLPVIPIIKILTTDSRFALIRAPQCGIPEHRSMTVLTLTFRHTSKNFWSS